MSQPSKESKLKWYNAHKDKMKAYYKKYAIDNKEKILEYRRLWYRGRGKDIAKERRINLRKLWLDILDNLNLNKCTTCGYSKCIAAIDLHHPNPKMKTISPGNLLNRIPTEDRITLLKQCIPLCANCHRELHYSFSNEAERKAPTNNLLNGSTINSSSNSNAAKNLGGKKLSKTA